MARRTLAVALVACIAVILPATVSAAPDGSVSSDNLRIIITAPGSVHAGQPFRVSVRLINRSGAPIWLHLTESLPAFPTAPAFARTDDPVMVARTYLHPAISPYSGHCSWYWDTPPVPAPDGTCSINSVTPGLLPAGPSLIMQYEVVVHDAGADGLVAFRLEACQGGAMLAMDTARIVLRPDRG